MPDPRSEMRLVPQRPFPAYSYVPGHFPHPNRDPEGHSYGAASPSVPDLSCSPWQTCGDYLFGFDLFNGGYYWEAHETWEALWHAAGRRGTTAALLQGLIKLAAAAVKMREGNPVGRRRHAIRARELFHLARKGIPAGNSLLGLQLGELLDAASLLEELRGESREPDVHFQAPVVLLPRE